MYILYYFSRILKSCYYEYKCLVFQLFSSGLKQSGEDEEGIFGFMEKDIKKEINRGKRLVSYSTILTKPVVSADDCNSVLHLFFVG